MKLRYNCFLSSNPTRALLSRVFSKFGQSLLQQPLTRQSEIILFIVDEESPLLHKDTLDGGPNNLQKQSSIMEFSGNIPLVTFDTEFR